MSENPDHSLPHTDSRKRNLPFKVYVDDNYHHGDPSERTIHGDFATAEEAANACRRIVWESLCSSYQDGMTAEEVLENYKMFGDDPFIVASGDDEIKFSAWDYAREISSYVCKFMNEHPAVSIEGTFIDLTSDTADICPMCGQKSQCEHLVAILDSDNRLCGGLAYDRIEEWMSIVYDILRLCIHRDMQSAETVGSLGIVLQEVLDFELACILKNPAKADEKALHKMLEEKRSDFEWAICDCFGPNKSVIESYSKPENQSGVSYHRYWSADPKSVVDRLSSGLIESLSALQT